MSWHIINHKDYIDGPFDSMDSAVREARTLGDDHRVDLRLKRRSDGFYVYKPPYNRVEHWQPEYWICTKEAALREGISEAIFEQPMLETWR